MPAIPFVVNKDLNDNNAYKLFANHLIAQGTNKYKYKGKRNVCKC